MSEQPLTIATNGTTPSSSSPVPLGSSVIPIVNKLQDIVAQLGSQSTIELPQVAVVGSQSSGKSSVLEALVGRDFLPRGNEICTRRPLVLQLLQTKKKNQDGAGEEYGEFLHLPGRKFYQFSDIRREIQAETDREAGANKGVVDKQIRLKIFSPYVLDITLVDLPGITKVPVGDQPSDIEARIRTMIMSYIKQPTCLILAVTPANSDLANSDALQMAGMADPDGNRTIGVITKLDIMDRGTDARNLLMGKVIPLRLGYVGVVNRSQEDIMFNRSIKDALKEEDKFFKSRPIYNGIADRCGIPQLAKKLNQVLVQHIKNILPGLKSRISKQLATVAKEHASFGEIVESKAGQGALLLNILHKYTEAFSSVVEGKNEDMSTVELSGGARIHYIFQQIFVKSLEEVDPCEDLSDDDIRTAIQNATGPRSALFVPEVPFVVLVKRQIARLLDPSLQCARFIYEELIKISHHCLGHELQRFPVLRKCMEEVVVNFLREGLEPCESRICDQIAMELGYINTSHRNFIGGNKAIEIALQQAKLSTLAFPISKQKDGVELEKSATLEKSTKSRAILGRQLNGVVTDQVAKPVAEIGKSVASGSTSWGMSSFFGGNTNSRVAVREASTNKIHNEPVNKIEQVSCMIHLQEPPIMLRPSENHSEQETLEIAVTKMLLTSYYDIVRKNIEDFVPKVLMHFLVNSTKHELHNVFIRQLYRENLYEELLQEPSEVAVKRKRTRETLHILQQAFRTLDELPLEAETAERGYNLGQDPTGLPKVINVLSKSSRNYYNTGSNGSYTASPDNPFARNSFDSGEFRIPFTVDCNTLDVELSSFLFGNLDILACLQFLVKLYCVALDNVSGRLKDDDRLFESC
ncbi:hypothetical protein ACFE04_002125 [Oxalis oulophora]